ncbi:hypothetical protein DLAC_11181 [Tieghemostelium lacteum]|uniref:E3 ubiquitin-protein ligase n=1 Tax=Tieghemostelium lacteum TaxID=361077 RepID=A0A151Z3F0_TIELA|nr:hypothetical protein DLAC_11181 [Tieghemostelium lacteum]|eukprot:KYQ88469.1 hypothetical protein DLAC_11181 [Tieghemostelium lacteum]
MNNSVGPLNNNIGGAPNLIWDRVTFKPLLDKEFQLTDVFGYLETNETTKSRLDTLPSTLLSESLQSILRKTSVHRFPFCQHEWTKKTYFFRCKDCCITETSCVCIDCFRKGNHIEEGHSFMIEESGMGGCCDCGNADSFYPKGFCSEHFLPEKPDHPAQKLESEEFRMKLYCLFRIVSLHLCNLLINYREEQDPNSFKIIRTVKQCETIFNWLDAIARSSYPILYIISEEFCNRLLNPVDFKLYDNSSPLPYLNKVPSRFMYSQNQSILRTILEIIVEKPEILNIFRPLVITLLGNRLFKQCFCEEFLIHYPSFALSSDMQFRSLISAVACQMFELPSIAIPFSTGSSKQNLISTLIRVNLLLINKKSQFNFFNHTDRTLYDNVFSPNQDMIYVSNGLKHQAITKYLSQDENLSIVNQLLIMMDEIQMMCPVFRQLDKPLPYELGVIPTLTSLECQSLSSWENFLQSLQSQSISIKKFLKMIVSHIQSKGFDSYRSFNYEDSSGQYVLVESNIYDAKVPVPFHLVNNRAFGVFLLNYLWGSPDYSKEFVKECIGSSSIAKLATQSMLPIVMMGQYLSKHWEKNVNIQEYFSYYTWSFMGLDLFTLQYCSLLLGHKHFLLLSLSNFTGGFQIQTSESLSDFIKFVITILQNRLSQKYGLKEARYHLIQGLSSNVSTYAKLCEYRKEFLTMNVEETVKEVSVEKDKKLRLRPELWSEFDPYYPYLFYEKNSLLNTSFNNYYEYLKQQHHPISESYPLPCKTEPLPDALLPLLEMINEPFLIDIVQYILLNYLQPSYRISNQNHIEIFLQNYLVSYSSSTDLGNIYDGLMNHCLYLLNLSLRIFKTQMWPTYSDNLKLKITKRIGIFVKQNSATTETPIDVDMDDDELQEIESIHLSAKDSDQYTNNFLLLLLKNNENQPCNLLNLIITISKKMDKQSIFTDKKNLFNNLLMELYQFDSRFENLFDIKDFLSQQSQIEMKLKKEKAMAFQAAIKEKMKLQQLKFLQESSGDNMDLEDNSMITKDNNNNQTKNTSSEKPCVVCKLNHNHAEDELLAIGLFEQCSMKKFSNVETLKFAKVPDGVAVHDKTNLVITIDSFTTHGLYDFIGKGLNTLAHTCGHYIHKKCLFNFMYHQDVFKCPLCNRISNMVLIIDKFDNQYDKQLSATLFNVIMTNDLTFKNPPYPQTSITSMYLWKHVVSNIEVLELISRSIDLYKDTPEDPDYKIYTNREFLRELNTLYLLYNNVMAMTNHYRNMYSGFLQSIQNQSNLDLVDPFITASVAHFLDRSQPPLPLLLKGYYQLIFNISQINTKKDIGTISKIALPYLRKCYLLYYHCYLGKPFDELEVNSENIQIIDKLESFQFIQEKLCFPSIESILTSQEYTQICIKMSLENIESLPLIPSLLSQLPRFIPLPSNHINFLLDNISRPCVHNCSELPKGVCLFCNAILCYGECCSDEVYQHTHVCGYTQNLLMGVCKPDINVVIVSPIQKSFHLDLYYDKNNEAVHKSKPFIHLKTSSLRSIYINYLKSQFYNYEKNY